MMPGPHRPRFVFGATDLTLDWAARPWSFPNNTVGGVEWSAADIPASYKVKSERNIELNLRVHEHERTAVEELIEWGQTTRVITFYPEHDGTSYECRLVHPHVGEEWQPERDDTYPHQFFVRLTLRKTDGARWTEEYFT
jgi:hypothetical protein